jgi:hypothetical protein
MWCVHIRSIRAFAHNLLKMLYFREFQMPGHRTSAVDRGSVGFPAYDTVAGDNWTYRTNGFVGGGQLGYNWQSGALVFGLEGDVGYLGAKGSAPAPRRMHLL